jgi:hypothetical protein
MVHVRLFSHFAGQAKLYRKFDCLRKKKLAGCLLLILISLELFAKI